ncbi:MAG: hypothetical protein H0X29_09655 [Parachlamydiaceae bacterium]|nr:hypothetical protein [Parachlamydiaceae bacterium]
MISINNVYSNVQYDDVFRKANSAQAMITLDLTPQSDDTFRPDSSAPVALFSDYRLQSSIDVQQYNNTFAITEEEEIERKFIGALKKSAAASLASQQATTHHSQSKRKIHASLGKENPISQEKMNGVTIVKSKPLPLVKGIKSVENQFTISVKKMRALGLKCINENCQDENPKGFSINKKLCLRCVRYLSRNGSLPEIFRKKNLNENTNKLLTFNF